jgi:septum formation protein
MLINNKFILASTSKSRYNILKNNKLFFFIRRPLCDEKKLKRDLILKKTTIRNISLALAQLKSKSVSQKNPRILVVGSDTTIDFDGALLNKATNLKDAKKKILTMSGKAHTIYSSASVYFESKEVWNTTQKTTVQIRKLSEFEVDKYLLMVGKGILSSVGCYHIEAEGPNIIEEIKGDFFNVMGFPLFPFLNFLKKNKTEKKL